MGKRRSKRPMNFEKFAKKRRTGDHESSEEEEKPEPVIEPGLPSMNIPDQSEGGLNAMDEGDSSGSEEFNQERNEIRTAQVKSKQAKKKKSGGFQSMGLSPAIFKAIRKLGYQLPTPIQRKTIPVILEGKDVVAMARTGSGKSAAFLIPMFERLCNHARSVSGARALIISPTRELALQTLQFTKDLGKYTDLKATIVLGGDRMIDQFEALHGNPDILIATPGRLLHVCMEMKLKLSSVEYVVFDEADRLFELGFQTQLKEILHRLSDQRQTVLFSATLPKLMVDFAQAGLVQPTLIRLDVETKLSDKLTLNFLKVRSDDKLSLLVYFLRTIIQTNEQTMVFLATKHHVDHVYNILQETGIACSYLYSSMDGSARKINTALFRNKKVNVLLVTDLAARGIDIPLLDNVINYHFPARPKLFVHRVGRVARAGNTGTAYSFVSFDEVAYALDLHLFLGKKLKICKEDAPQDTNGLYGCVPHSVIDEEDGNLHNLNQRHDMQALLRTSGNGYKHYLRSRPPASHQSIKRAKLLCKMEPKMHPMFNFRQDVSENALNQYMAAMKTYRPKSTIFEINPDEHSQSYKVMKSKRKLHDKKINNPNKKQPQFESDDEEMVTPHSLQEGTDADIENVFSDIIDDKKRKKKVNRDTKKDSENYTPYQPVDALTERGLSVGLNFHDDATKASVDVMGDDRDNLDNNNKLLKWDRKKKKFIGATGKEANQKKIKTESGAVINASYCKDLYRDWLHKNKITLQTNDDEEFGESEFGLALKQHKGRRLKPGGLNMPLGTSAKGGLNDSDIKNKFNKDGTVKTTAQIVKDRLIKQRNIDRHNAKKVKAAKEKQSRKKKGYVPTTKYVVIPPRQNRRAREGKGTFVVKA